MAKPFVLTTQLQIQIPNLNQVVSQLNKGLGNVNVPVNINIPKNTNTQLTNLNKNVKNAGTSARNSAKSFDQMRNSLRGALTYIAKYDAAREIFNLFAQTVRDGVSSAIAFEKEMVKVSQVTGRTMKELKGLEREITRVSTGFGVSSGSLIKTSRVLAQTGMSARDARIALEALAKTTLAATFDDITSTTETAIAAMRQFGIASTDLEKTLGKINSLAASFAVEAGDIGVAVRRAGGAFKAAGGSLDELNALFTAVRSTTRETAETIATGFRTIFTRIQRPKTIQFLKQLGVQLQDLQGNFIGPFEAVRRLNIALKDLDPRDVRYSQIIEQLGGFRQVSKVIPLIQQFGTAQKALNVSQQGGTSLAKDAAKAQQSLAVQLTKVKEEYQALFREIFGGQGMQTVIKTTLKLASAFAKVADSLAPIIPLIATIGAAKLVQFAAFGSLGRGKKQGGRIHKFASGGMVPGQGNTDSVPAMLTPGEFVIRKSSVKAIGAGRLQGMNRYNRGGPVSGPVSGPASRSKNVTKKYNVNENGITDEYSGNIKVTTLGKGASYEKVEKEAAALYDKGKKAYDKAIAKKLGQEQALSEARLAIEKGGKLKPSATASFFGKPLKNFFKGSVSSKRGSMNYLRGSIHERNTYNYLKNRGRKSGTIKKLDDKYGADFSVTKGRNTTYVEAKTLSSSRASQDKIIAKALLAKAGVGTYKQSPAKLDNVPLGQIEFIEAPKGGKGSKASGLAVPRPRRANRGGGISSTDTVPALLTPGEFVINRKSAAKIGYGNLDKANRFGQTPKGFATGGIVGVKKYNNGGKESRSRMGGGGMSLFFGIQTILPLLADSFKNAEDKATKLSMGFDAAAQGLMTFAALNFAAGDLLDGFGKKTKIAATSLASAASVGLAIYQYIKQQGIEREKEATTQLEGGGFRNETSVNTLRQEFVAARKQQQVDATKYANLGAFVTGGAVAGGQIGFAAGSATGPGALVTTSVGVIVGAIAGLIGGLTTNQIMGNLNFDRAGAVKEFNEKVRALKLGVGIEDLQTALKAFSEGKASIGSIAAVVQGGIRNLEKGFTQIGSAEGLESFQGQLKNTLPALTEYVQKVTDSANSFQELQTIVGADTLNTFSQLSGVSLPALEKQIRSNVEQRRKSTAAQKANIAAIQATNQVLYRARDSVTGFDEIERRLKRFDNVLDGVASSIDNTFSTMSIGQIAPNFDDITNIFDMSSFSAQVDSLSGLFGQSGQALGQDLKNFAALNSLLPNILTEAAGQIGISGARASEIIERKLMAADPGGIIGAEFRRVIAQRVQAIAEMGEGGEGKFANRIRTDIEGVVRDLTKGMSETAEAFKRAAEFVDNANRRLASVYGLRTQLEMKIANQLSTIIGLQASNLERLAQAQRKDVRPEQQQNTFNSQQNALLTGTSIAGLGSNINIVANNFKRLKERIKESDAAIANLGVSADSSGEVIENNRALIDENARLKSEFAKTKQVLENYANVQARVGRIQEEIANAQKKKDAARSLAQDFAFGTNQDRRNLFRDLQAASVAAAQGLDAIPQQLRGNVLSVLQRLEDSPVFAGGQTGQDVIDRIINDQSKYMPPGMRKMLAAIFKDGATEEQRFIKRLSQIQDEAVKAQQAFLQGMHDDSKDLKESIAKLNQTLTNDLRKIFAEQENRALAREVGESKGILASSKSQLEQLKKIQSAGIPVQNPAVLQAVRANVDGIKALKEAREKQAKFGTAADESFRAVNRAGFAAAGDQGSARANERAIRNLGTYFRNRFGVEVGNQLTQSARDALVSFLAANPNASAAEVAEAVSAGVQGFALEREGTAQSIIEEQMKRLNLAGLGPYVDTLIKNVDGISTALSSLPSEATWQSLNESIVQTTTTINNANASIAANNAGGPVRRAAGGGIFAPHGTDTVPAMLTPGEFVVNKKAAQNNMSALKSLNSGKTQYLAGGGEVKIGNFLGTNAGDEKLDPKGFNDKRSEAARLLLEHHKRYATGGGTGSVFDQATRYLAKKYIDSDMQGEAKGLIKALDTGNGIEMGVGQYKEPNLRKYYSGAIANLPLAVANYMEKGFLGVNGFSYGNISGIDTLDDYRRGYFAYINRNGVADSKDGGNLSSGHKLKDNGYDQISKLQVMAGSDTPGGPQARQLYVEMQQWADNAMSTYGANGANVGGAFSFKFRKGKVDDYTNDETGTKISGFDFPVIKPEEIAQAKDLASYFSGSYVGDNKLSVRATGFKKMDASSEVSSQAPMSVPVGMLDPLYETMEKYLFSTGANYGYTVKGHLGKNTQKIKDATKNKQWGFYDEIWRSIWPDKWKRPNGYNYLDEPMAQFAYMANQIDKSLTTTERQLAKSSPFDVTDADTWAKAFTTTGPASSLRGIAQSREKAIRQATNWFSQDGFKDFGGKADEARFFGMAIQSIGNELGFTTAGIDAAGLLGIVNDAGAQGLNEEERIKKKVEDIQMARGASKGLPVDGVGAITTVVRQVIESMKKNRNFTRIPQYAKARSANLKKYRDFYKVKNWGSKDSKALFPWLSQFAEEIQRMMSGGLIRVADADGIQFNESELLRQLTRIQDARNKNQVINEQVMGVQNFGGQIKEMFLGGGSLLDRMVTFGTTGANSWYRTKVDNELPFYKTFGLTKVREHVAKFQAEAIRSFNTVAKLYKENKKNEKPVKLATGGRVPQRLASGGGVSSFTPHGTDTVPAMLTPGEFVVNKKAAQANMPLLQSINGSGGAKTSGGTQYLAGGGMVSDWGYASAWGKSADKYYPTPNPRMLSWPDMTAIYDQKQEDEYGWMGKGYRYLNWTPRRAAKLDIEKFREFKKMLTAPMRDLANVNEEALGKDAGQSTIGTDGMPNIRWGRLGERQRDQIKSMIKSDPIAYFGAFRPADFYEIGSTGGFTVRDSDKFNRFNIDNPEYKINPGGKYQLFGPPKGNKDGSAKLESILSSGNFGADPGDAVSARVVAPELVGVLEGADAPALTKKQALDYFAFERMKTGKNVSVAASDPMDTDIFKRPFKAAFVEKKITQSSVDALVKSTGRHVDMLGKYVMRNYSAITPENMSLYKEFVQQGYDGNSLDVVGPEDHEFIFEQLRRFSVQGNLSPLEERDRMPSAIDALAAGVKVRKTNEDQAKRNWILKNEAAGKPTDDESYKKHVKQTQHEAWGDIDASAAGSLLKWVVKWGAGPFHAGIKTMEAPFKGAMALGQMIGTIPWAMFGGKEHQDNLKLHYDSLAHELKTLVTLGGLFPDAYDAVMLRPDLASDAVSGDMDPSKWFKHSLESTTPYREAREHLRKSRETFMGLSVFADPLDEFNWWLQEVPDLLALPIAGAKVAATKGMSGLSKATKVAKGMRSAASLPNQTARIKYLDDLMPSNKGWQDLKNKMPATKAEYMAHGYSPQDAQRLVNLSKQGPNARPPSAMKRAELATEGAKTPEQLLELSPAGAMEASDAGASLVPNLNELIPNFTPLHPSSKSVLAPAGSIPRTNKMGVPTRSFGVEETTMVVPYRTVPTPKHPTGRMAHQKVMTKVPKGQLPYSTNVGKRGPGPGPLSQAPAMQSINNKLKYVNDIIDGVKDNPLVTGLKENVEKVKNLAAEARGQEALAVKNARIPGNTTLSATDIPTKQPIGVTSTGKYSTGQGPLKHSNLPGHPSDLQPGVPTQPAGFATAGTGKLPLADALDVESFTRLGRGQSSSLLNQTTEIVPYRMTPDPNVPYRQVGAENYKKVLGDKSGATGAVGTRGQGPLTNRLPENKITKEADKVIEDVATKAEEAAATPVPVTPKPTKPAPTKFTPEQRPPTGRTVDLDAGYALDASGKPQFNSQAQRFIKEGRYVKTNRGWTDVEGVRGADGLNPVVPDSALYQFSTPPNLRGVKAGPEDLDIVLPTKQGMPFRSRAKTPKEVAPANVKKMERSVKKAEAQAQRIQAKTEAQAAQAQRTQAKTESQVSPARAETQAQQAADAKRVQESADAQTRAVQKMKDIERRAEALEATEARGPIQAKLQENKIKRTEAKLQKLAGQTEVRTASGMRKIEDLVDDDMVRIYRGEKANPESQGGRWWTISKKHAEGYIKTNPSEKTALLSIEVPWKDIKKYDVTNLSQQGGLSEIFEKLHKSGQQPTFTQKTLDFFGINKNQVQDLSLLQQAARDAELQKWQTGFELYLPQKYVDDVSKNPNLIRTSLGDAGAMPKPPPGGMKDPAFADYAKEVNRRLKELGRAAPDSDIAIRQPETPKGKRRRRGFANGGLVSYFSGGGPAMGTDTIPAMLTPGEFVVRRAAVDAVGVETLRAINNMGRGSTSSKPKKRAGVNYLANGGEGEATGMRMPTLDVRDFNMAISKFDSSVDRLEKIFGNGIQMTHNFEDMNVIVTVNGNFGDEEGELSRGMQRRINKEVRKGINDFIDRSFPDIPRMDIA